jgi:hypothetical protein
MGERPDQIEQHIRHERHELEQNFNQLEAKVKDAFDWKSQFEQHSGALLGAAFVGGALLAAIVPKGSSRRSHDDDVFDRSVPSRAHSFTEGQIPYTNPQSAASQAYSGYTGKARSASNNAWDTLRMAAIGLASTRLSEYIDQLVPGFTEHYKKAAAGDLKTPFFNTPSNPPSGQTKPNGGAEYKPNGGTDHQSHS